MADTDLQQTIIDAAQSAEQVTVDGTTTRERSLSELIEADKYLANKGAAARSRLPIRFAKIVPGGAD